MADVILTEGDSRHNRSSNSSLSSAEQLSKHIFRLTKDFIHGLSEVRAMIQVAKSGLYDCPRNTQQSYLNRIDGIVEGAMLSFMEIVETYRDKDEPKRE